MHSRAFGAARRAPGRRATWGGWAPRNPRPLAPGATSSSSPRALGGMPLSGAACADPRARRGPAAGLLSRPARTVDALPTCGAFREQLTRVRPPWARRDLAGVVLHVLPARPRRRRAPALQGSETPANRLPTLPQLHEHKHRFLHPPGQVLQSPRAPRRCAQSLAARAFRSCVPFLHRGPYGRPSSWILGRVHT